MIFHVGAKSALLRRFFMLMHKKAPSARSLAPPFQIATACAGLRFGFGCRPGRQSSKLSTRFTWSQSKLCDHVFLCPRQKRRHPPASLLLLSKSQPLTLGCDLVFRCRPESYSISINCVIMFQWESHLLKADGFLLTTLSDFLDI